MTYGDFENMPKRTGSHKVSYDKAIDIAKNPMDIKGALLQWFTISLIKSLTQVGLLYVQIILLLKVKIY